MLQVAIHTSEDMLWIPKQRRYCWDTRPDMMFLTVKNLTVVCMKEQPVTSHLRFTTRIDRWSIFWRVSNTAVKTKVLRVMTLLTHVSSSNSAWRKQTSATNTRIYQFTSDKTDDRQNILLLRHDGSEWRSHLDCM